MTTSEHDALGRPSRTTDPVARVSTTSYDADGHVLVERRGVGSAVEIAYATHAWTPDGLQAALTDANGNRTAYAYDGFDRLAQATFPSPSAPGSTNPADFESFGYDANGNATSHRMRGGETITTTFDALNRLITKTVPPYGGQSATVTTTTAYDLAGRQTSVSDTLGSTVASSYDAAGRLASSTETIPGLTGGKTVSYQYDAASNRTRLTWADGYFVQYGYDALNRMATASENGATTLATYTYDPQSRRTGLAYGNGTSVAYGYSAAGDLLTLAHNLAGTANDVSFTNTFTPAHQWATSTVSNAAFTFTPSVMNQPYVTNGLNQYTSFNGTTTHWDVQGNYQGTLVGTFTYDAENRLMATGTTATYGYDPQGRRTRKTISGAATYFVHDGDSEIAEYDGTGALVRRFVPGPAIDEYVAMVTAAGVKTFFHTDKMGSTVATSDASGNLAEGPYVYDAYGNCHSGAGTCATAGVPFRYTGQRLDAEFNLYYDRARIYSTILGRFFQTDPVGYGPDLDWYTYVGNDPTNKTDPTGKGAVDEGIWIAIGVGAVIVATGNAIEHEWQHSGLPEKIQHWMNNEEAPAPAHKPADANDGTKKAPAASDGLPDNATVVRGGTQPVAQGNGVVTNPDGTVSGVSVNAGTGTPGEVAAGIPHSNVRITTAGAVRGIGGKIEKKPTTNKPQHCEISDCKPEDLDRILGKGRPNPSSEQ